MIFGLKSVRTRDLNDWQTLRFENDVIEFQFEHVVGMIGIPKLSRISLENWSRDRLK